MITPLNADVFLSLSPDCSPEERLYCERLLRPVAVRYEAFDTAPTDGVQRNVGAVWQRIRSCDALRQRRERELGRCYDAIVRTRPDILVKGPLPHAALWRAAQDRSELVMPPFVLVNPLYRVNDLFIVGGPQSMAKLCRLYDQWAQLQPKRDEAYGAEALMERYCRRVGLSLVLCQMPVHFFTTAKLYKLMQGGKVGSHPCVRVVSRLFGDPSGLLWRAQSDFWLPRLSARA